MAVYQSHLQHLHSLLRPATFNSGQCPFHFGMKISPATGIIWLRFRSMQRAKSQDYDSNPDRRHVRTTP